MKFSLFLLAILFTAFLIPELLMAQTPPPLPFAGTEQAPIDGGLGILAAAGGAYAIKKLRDRQNPEI